MVKSLWGVGDGVVGGFVGSNVTVGSNVSVGANDPPGDDVTTKGEGEGAPVVAELVGEATGRFCNGVGSNVSGSLVSGNIVSAGETVSS